MTGQIHIVGVKNKRRAKDESMQITRWLRIGVGPTAFQAVCVSAAALFAQAGPPPSRVDPKELRAYVARFTGAFWTFKQDHGRDSFVFQGLLGTSEGTMYQFWYDGSPCGGPGCAGRFSLSRCNKPAVLVGSRGRGDFGCHDANH